MTVVLKNADLGELSYNGWVFDSFHHSKVTNRVVPDDAGRVVKWQEVTIEVEADIDLSSFPDQNTAVHNLWNSLTEPGGSLAYSDKGFGEFKVNHPDTDVRDVNWGPKPEMIDFVPVGGNRVVHIHWKVTAHVVSCSPAFYKRHLFNFTFEVGYDLDSDGYLTRSLSGAYEIPLTFATNQGAGGVLTVPDSADNWWKRVCPPVPVGFQRVTKNRRVSKDRRRVDYQIVDKELPVPLMPDCTMIEAKYRVRNEKGMIFANWACTISGTVRINPALPRSASWDRFGLLVRSRLNWIRRNVAAPGQPVPTGPVGKRISGVLLMNTEFEEDIFGKDARFSVTFRMLGATLRWILQQSGLWLPVPKTSYAIWKASMDRRINLPHGPSEAVMSATDDVMIDLCGGPASAVVSPGRINALNADMDAQSRAAGGNAPETSGALGDSSEQFPDAEHSWISYRSNLDFVEDDNIIRHKPLAGKVTVSSPKQAANGSVGPIQSRTGDPDFLLADWNVPDIQQRVCSPDTSVVLSGTAIRLGYRAEAPRLIRFGGKTLTQTAANIKEVELGNIEGIPVYGLAWRIEYNLSEPAQKMDTLANPLFGSSGNGSLSLPTAISPGGGGTFRPNAT